MWKSLSTFTRQNSVCVFAVCVLYRILVPLLRYNLAASELNARPQTNDHTNSTSLLNYLAKSRNGCDLAPSELN